MARSDEARAALGALAEHTDLLVQAILEDGGHIESHAETETAIRRLQRHGLVVQLDEQESQVQVAQVVGELVRHVTKSHQRQLSHGAIADLVSELQHVLDLYFLARDQAVIEDERTLFFKLYELVANLVLSLRQISARFASYIQNEFVTISSLELRIRENRRAVDEAHKLNQLLDTIGPSDLMQWSRNLPKVQRLLTNTLSRNLTRIRGDLIDASHRLRENLGKLEKDREVQAWNSLIDALLAHYERNLNYMPSIDLLESALERHAFFSLAEPVELRAFPDLENRVQADELRELAIRALKEIDVQDGPERRELPPAVPVEDVTGTESVQSEDALDQALAWLFEAVEALAPTQPVSVGSAYATLQPDTSMRLWLAAAWERYLLLTEDGRCVGIAGEWVGEVMGPYTGTRIVTDLRFQRSAR